MSIVALRYLNRLLPMTLRPVTQSASRMYADDCSKDPSEKTDPNQGEPWGGKKDFRDCHKPPTIVCSTCLPPFEKKESPLPNVPPCPVVPQCPPSVCPPFADPNNPCNYSPPPCPDPDAPNLTRLKKYQCLFQQNGDDIPIFLKKGRSDAILYQLTVLLVAVSFFSTVYSMIKVAIK